MSHGLEHALANFASVATLVKDAPRRQVWRFVFNDRPYYLSFHPRAGRMPLARLFRGSPAWREFDRLRRLQKAGVCSPRAVAYLSGFIVNTIKGDAAITEGIEPGHRLDALLDQALLDGTGVPGPVHRILVDRVLSLLERMQAAGLGHSDLQLGSLLVQDEQVFLIDGAGVERRKLRPADLLRLAASAAPHVTRTDLLRFWRGLGFGERLPAANHAARRLRRKQAGLIFGDNDSFGRLRIGAWSVAFFKHAQHPRRWASASARTITTDDWNAAWPRLLEQMKSDQFDILKRTADGDVLAGQVVLGGHPLTVVVKHPRRRYWHRYISEIGRGARPRRAWRKSWGLVVRDIPTAWPLLLAERRVLGYAVDSLTIFQHVPGTLLPRMDLDAISAAARDTMFRRLGRTLRLMEAAGLCQRDAKMYNWVIGDDPQLGPVPVVIDVDGVRRYSGQPAAISRLLRSMREHRQYTVADSLALCRGYAPFAPVGMTQTP